MQVVRLILALVCMLALAGNTLGLPSSPPVARASSVGTLYLPIVMLDAPARSPLFGFEVREVTPFDARLLSQAEGLHAKWVRLNSLSWRQIQPTRERVYNWAAAARFERDLRTAFAARLTPIVVIDDHPHWATVLDSSCAALKQEAFEDFAAFMHELVLRYAGPPFNVHDWELGNEPDVDPRLVGQDSHFGCWGNEGDRFYGGEHYGAMLKAVTPVIKQTDPTARVWIGGLLLNNPDSCTELPGKPACFFEGVLRSGAAPFFDVVPYHAYAQSDALTSRDHSGLPSSVWGEAGFARGKPRFLKDIMQRYGVSKPLFLNEAALRCPPYLPTRCADPNEAYLEDQANHVTRLLVRTLSEGVEGVIWYSLDGLGWENSGLLDRAQRPRPAYAAFQTLSSQTLFAAGAPVAIGYGSDTEAYRFTARGKLIDVVWSRDHVLDLIQVPANEFITAYDRDGRLMMPTVANGTVTLPVGFSAVYIQRRP